MTDHPTPVKEPLFAFTEAYTHTRPGRHVYVLAIDWDAAEVTLEVFDPTWKSEMQTTDIVSFAAWAKQDAVEQLHNVQL